mgnify:CR=1 FL=1|tara:strand:+ start:2535 stop:2867 length:333 start_codon:yes stop_codon:yes gene_type:complete
MSFDANMRGLPKGTLFFAEVYMCRGNSELFEQGIRADDVLYCEMMSHCNDDPTVCIKLPTGENLMVSDSTDGDNIWLVYAGDIDMTGFICDNVKTKAKKLMKENNNEHRK